MKKNFSQPVRLGALLLGASSILSRFLGLLRDYVFSKIFGIELDAYYIAFRIPDLLYTLLILGALSSAFIPLYTRLRRESAHEGDLFASQILSAAFFLLLLCSLGLFLLAPFLVPLIAPGFELAIQKEAIFLTRIMLLSPVFLGLSGILQGIENTHKKFLGMALAPLFYNASIILSALLFGRVYGTLALAFGVLCGSFLHFFVQVPGALKSSFRFSLLRPRWTAPLREFFHLALPRVLGIAATQFTLLIDYALASLLPLGAVSVYSYSLNLQSFPYGVVAISFSVAVFSTLAEQALEKDKTAFVSTLRSSFHVIWFWVFPAVLGLFFLREPLVLLILQGGAFDAEAAQLTVQTFAILLWAALPQSFIPLWSRAFYSLSNTRTPVRIGLYTLCLNAALSFLFIYILHWPVQALALSNLISSSFNALFLLFSLRSFLRVSIKDFFDFRRFLNMLLAAGSMSLLVYFLSMLSYPHTLLQLFIPSAGGALVYLGLSKVLKCL